MKNNNPAYNENYDEFRNKKFIIYKIINKINGMVYVGKSKRSFSRRYPGSQWWIYTSNEYLKNDSIKYGKDSFDIVIVKHNIDITKLGEEENGLINELNSIYPNGYNKVSATKDGDYISCEETKRKQSEIQKIIRKTDRRSGWHWTEEQKNKLRKPLMKNAKAVIQIDPKTLTVIKEYLKMSDAVKETGFSSISMACNRKIIYAGGYIWRFKDDPDWKPRESLAHLCQKPVVKIDKDTNEILECFNSVSEAARKVGSYPQNISRSCQEGILTCGFKWSYKNEIT